MSGQHLSADEINVAERYINEHRQLCELVHISALRKSHERDIIDRIDALLQAFQLSQSTWRVRVETLERTYHELFQRHRELGDAACLTQEKLRSVGCELAAARVTHEAAIAQLHNTGAECDKRIAAAVLKERQAAESWKESVALEAQHRVEQALGAERERLKAAHAAGLDTVLSAAEKDRAAHISASLDALEKANDAKRTALAAAQAASLRCQKAEESAAAAQTLAVELQRQLTASQSHHATAQACVAECKERCRQLTIMLDVTRQGQAEFRCVLEARHAAALQAQQLAAETAFAAAKAELAAEAQAVRERCAAAMRQMEEQAREWRGRYFEAVARVEACEWALARLGKDSEKAEGTNASATASAATSFSSPAVSTGTTPHSHPDVACCDARSTRGEAPPFRRSPS